MCSALSLSVKSIFFCPLPYLAAFATCVSSIPLHSYCPISTTTLTRCAECNHRCRGVWLTEGGLGLCRTSIYAGLGRVSLLPSKL
jgi:hypothetical protein